VDAAGIFIGLLLVTNIAIHRLGAIGPFGVFVQIDDIHMAAGAGIGPVHRVGVFFPFYGGGMALHAILGEDGPFHMDIDGDLARVGEGGEGEEEKQERCQQNDPLGL